MAPPTDNQDLWGRIAQAIADVEAVYTADRGRNSQRAAAPSNHAHQRHSSTQGHYRHGYGLHDPYYRDDYYHNHRPTRHSNAALERRLHEEREYSEHALRRQMQRHLQQQDRLRERYYQEAARFEEDAIDMAETSAQEAYEKGRWDQVYSDMDEVRRQREKWRREKERRGGQEGGGVDSEGHERAAGGERSGRQRRPGEPIVTFEIEEVDESEFMK